MAGLCVGRNGPGVARREADLLRELGADGDAEVWLAERRPRWIHGTPDAARAQVAAFAAAGAERIVLQDFLPRDLAMIDEAAEFLFG